MASAVPIEKPETLRVQYCRCYAFGCKCKIVAIRGRSIGWLAVGDIPKPLYRVPFFVFASCIRLFFMGSLHVSAFYLYFLGFAFMLLFFCCVLFPFLSFCRFCLVLLLFFSFSLDLCKCSSDLVLSCRPRTIGLATASIIVLGVVEA